MQRYARLRRSRVTRIQRTARDAGRTYHLTGPAAYARDLVIRAMGAKRLLARQDWIYDWRACRAARKVETGFPPGRRLPEIVFKQRE